MVTAVINLDLIPLFFFFILYSALEIFISTTMEDYRSRSRFIDIEIEQRDFESDEEDDEFEEDDDDDRERDEHVIPERSGFSVDLGVFNDERLEDDDDEDEFDDDDDEEYEEDYEEEEDEDELLFPVVRMLHRDSIEEDDNDNDYDYEDEEEEDYVEEGEEEEEEDYEEEELEELFPAVMTSPRVSNEVLHDRSLESENSDDSESCGGKIGNQDKCGGEISGSVCSICFEAWTSGGEHQICCLPCGHIYGLSCIKKWLQQSRGSGKCPQCNNICTFKDVRVLYASRLCVADEELQKRVRSLEAKCAYLEQKAASSLTPDQLIDQICSNPAAVERLAKILARSYQQPVSP